MRNHVAFDRLVVARMIQLKTSFLPMVNQLVDIEGVHCAEADKMLICPTVKRFTVFSDKLLPPFSSFERQEFLVFNSLASASYRSSAIRARR